MEKSEFILKLLDLIHQYDDESTAVENAPAPGTVNVKPSGVNGLAHGVSRPYPTMESLGIPWTADAWAYTVRLAFGNMRRPDGSAYCQQATTYAVNASPYAANGASVAKAGGDPTPFYAEAIDRVEHPDDWATQAELDKALANAQAHAGESWISQPAGEEQIPEG